MTSPPRPRLAAAALAVTGTVAAAELLRRRPPGGRERWTRTNFRDAEVDLLGGPTAAAGALATCLPLAARGLVGPALVTSAAAALGVYDDLAGETHARGLRGHFRALRQGRITTGLVKMGGLAAAGIAAAALQPGPRPTTDVAIDGALISGTANLVNLLDLRPGRALKAVVLVAVPVTVLAPAPGATAAGGTLATAACLLPADLAERRMLGDGGANTLGALLGWSLAAAGGRPTRVAALTVVVALTLVSERTSFSAVIDRSRLLRALDAWGRVPA